VFCSIVEETSGMCSSIFNVELGNTGAELISRLEKLKAWLVVEESSEECSLIFTAELGNIGAELISDESGLPFEQQ